MRTTSVLFKQEIIVKSSVSVTWSKLYKLVGHIGMIESIERNEYSGKFASNHGNSARILLIL